jgi:hypothetical protein
MNTNYDIVFDGGYTVHLSKVEQVSCELHNAEYAPGTSCQTTVRRAMDL